MSKFEGVRSVILPDVPRSYICDIRTGNANLILLHFKRIKFYTMIVRRRGALALESFIHHGSPT